MSGGEGPGVNPGFGLADTTFGGARPGEPKQRHPGETVEERVGKNKKKQRERAYEDSVRGALDNLYDAQRAARETFDQAFERLERKGSSRLERIVEGARADASEVAGALRAVLDRAETASGDLLARLGDVSEGVAERIDAEVEAGRTRLDACAHDAEAGIEALQSRVREKLDSIVADAEHRRLAVDVAWETIERLEASVEEQVLELDAWRARGEAAQAEMDAVVAGVRSDGDTALGRVQWHVDQAQTAVTEAVARARAEVQTHVDEAVVGAEEQVGEIVSRAEARISGRVAEAAAQVESCVDDRVAELVARVEADATDRMGVVSAELREQMTQRGEELFQQVDSNARAEIDAIVRAAEGDGRAVEAARLAAEEITTELQAHGRERLDDAARRGEGILAEMAAIADGLRSDAAAKLVTIFTDSESLAGQLSEDSRRRLDQVGDETARHAAELLVALEQNAQELERAARARLDDVLRAFEEQTTAVLQSAVDEALALVEHAADEHEGEDQQPDAADYGEARDGNEGRDGDESEDEVPHDDEYAAEDQPAVSWGPGRDLWEGPPAPGAPASVDDNFFARLAAELRESDTGALPRAEDQFSAPAAWPRTAGVPAEALRPVAATRSVDVLEVGRVAVSVPVGLVSAQVRQLLTSAPGQPVRVELRKSTPHRSTAVLQLVVADPRGWWEVHAIPLTGDVDADTSAIVDLSELEEALSAQNRFAPAGETTMVFRRDVEVGNFLLLARQHADLVDEPAAGERVEHIDLRRVAFDGATSAGVVLETQLGRVRVPAPLAGYLRRRRIERADLIRVDGAPRLSAIAPASGSESVSVTILGQLHEMGQEDGADGEERRSRGGEVAQLVSALSATTTVEDLTRILKVGVGYTRRRAASHPALPAEMIDDLLRDGTEAMRAAAAANPSISDEGATIAAGDVAATVRGAVAANPGISAELLEQLAADPLAQVRAAAASNPGVSAALLVELANDEDSAVRTAVAEVSTDVETLSILARDPDPAVCSAVAGNANCPSELLTELVAVAPESVLANPNVAKSLLVAGSKIDLPRLRAMVATNPTTPAKQLRDLARDDEVEVLRAVAEHPGAPSSVRRRALRRLERRPDDGL